MSKKKITRNHAIDYFVTACVAFIVIVVLGFWYVEDIRLGLSVIVESFLQIFFPEMVG